ncbi:MAG: hypothetical protein J6B59_01715, partial [Alistipes sp.]|nr:hypothetical protein [Alistipes sp.]
IVHRIAGEDIVVRALIVPQDVHLADNQKGGVKCGDNGIFKGCAPTHVLSPLWQGGGYKAGVVMRLAA